MAVNDVYKMDLRYTALSQRYQNSVYLKRIVAGEPSSADFLTVANDFKELLRARLSASVTYTDFVATQQVGGGVVWSASTCLPSGGRQEAGSFTGTLTGGDGAVADNLPPSASVVITLNTGFTGRRRRGRLYLGPFRENVQAEGLWIGALTANLVTDFGAQVAQFGQGGSDPNWRWVQWSRRIASGCEPHVNHPHTPTSVDTPNPTDAHKEVISVTVRNTCFNQRRRTLGVGR